MEYVLVALIVIGIPGLAIAAIVVAIRADRRARKAETLANALHQRVDRLMAGTPPVGAPTARPEPTPASRPLPTASAAAAPPPPPPEPSPQPRPSPAAPPPLAPLPPETELPVPEHEPTARESGPSLEERIGVFWFTRIGAVIGILVAGWFFKYMVDNEWIGPWGRVGIGALAGVVLLLWGERLARRDDAVHPYFAQGILGLGLSLLLVSAFASFAFYDLMRLETTFLIVAALCVLGGLLALRHRAEAILAISLVAVFLNPILLSTGEDRPLILFGYLLIMTGGALAVSVRMGFRVAPWLAIAATSILAIAWYVRFFGIFDLLRHEGAYAVPSARTIPLVFAALFPALWSAAGVAMRRRGLPEQGLALLLVATASAHAAFASLLYDRPVILGGVLCAVGVATAVLLVREEQPDWLALPLVAAYIALVVTTPAVEERGPTGAMLVAGALAAIYFAVILASAARRGTLGESSPPVLTGLAGLGLAGLGVQWLLPDRFLALAVILTGLAAVYLLLGLFLRRGEIGTFTLGAGLVGMLAAVSHADGLEPALLAVIAVWFLFHVGVPAVETLARGAAWSGPRLATLGGAGPGFVVLFLIATRPVDDRLRALLALGAAAVYLALGLRMLRMLRDGEESRDSALLPLGLGTALLTLALGFLLRGPGLTVAWAAQGAVLAFIASRTGRRGRPGHPFWLAASFAVLGIAIVRLLSVDTAWLDEQRELFLMTSGTSGTLRPEAFGHPLAWSLLGLGAALLVAARCVSRVRRAGSSFPGAAIALLVLGHGALLWLVIGEARLLFTEMPEAVPAGLSHEAFSERVNAFTASIRDQSARLGMVTTVTIGVYAGALLGIGFAAWSRSHRLLGIGLFAIAIGKLGLWDIWALRTLQKIAVGGSIAALLLAGGFLYARFGDRIRTLLIDSPDRTDLGGTPDDHPPP